MHTLYTTAAFVLGHFEHGETSRVYRLFTRSHGLLYVHAQGVREMRNRNRYALTTHAHAQVTLVRGKGAWRLTSAQTESCNGPLAWRRALALVGSLVAQEDPAPQLFDILMHARYAQNCFETGTGTEEAVLVLYLLHELGYVARPRSSLVDEVLAVPYAEALATGTYQVRQEEIVRAVNDTLEAVPQTR